MYVMVKKDCAGDVAFDEIGCLCNAALNYTNQCKLIKISQNKECSDFYFKDSDGTCNMYHFTFAIGERSNTLMNKLSNQGVMQKYKPKLSCHSQNTFSKTFYKISNICSYKINKQGYLFPCKKGEHLQNCKMFECNMMFKCPKFYCIPWGYICDGKWDCSGGYDESTQHQCGNRTCVNMFKCQMSSTCIHLGDVCNEFVDCPFGDDEYSCLLKYAICPSECQCLGFAIRCYYTYISLDILPVYFPYTSVTILNCTIFAKIQLQKPLENVSFLSITSTNLQNICTLVALMRHVIVLDASKNAINKMQCHCFNNKVNLRVVKLNNNMLQCIQKFAFFQLTSLLYLDLSNNMLKIIPEHFVTLSQSLSFCSFQNLLKLH